MTETTTNVAPIRTLTDEQALAWIAAQPDGRTVLQQAELARRWGWERYQVNRRLEAWRKAGLITQRGRAIVAATNRLQHADNAIEHQAATTATNPATKAATLPATNRATIPATKRATVAATKPATPTATVAGVAPPVAPAPPVEPDEIIPPSPPAPTVTYRRVLFFWRMRRHTDDDLQTITAGDLFGYSVAFALASIVAFFSLKGLVILFGFAPPAAIVWLGLTLEYAKLIGAAWLSACWRTVWWLYRAGIMLGVVGLMVVNASGVYSQLVVAHLGDRANHAADIDAKKEAIQASIDQHADRIADIDRQVAQIDAAIAEVIKRSHSAKAGINAMEGQRKARAGLVEQKNQEAAILADLKGSHAHTLAEGRRLDNEAAPIRAFAEMVGLKADDERAVRWLIALMVLCCDPLAVIFAAATAGRRRAT